MDKSKEEFQQMFKELNKFLAEIARKVASQVQSANANERTGKELLGILVLKERSRMRDQKLSQMI